MAKIIFDIPNTEYQRVINGLALYHGYQNTVVDPDNPESRIDKSKQLPNPESKEDFSHRMVASHIRNIVSQTEAKEAAVIASAAAADDVISKVIITPVKEVSP